MGLLFCENKEHVTLGACTNDVWPHKDIFVLRNPYFMLCISLFIITFFLRKSMSLCKDEVSVMVKRTRN
jgi:hypothetical protein